MKTKPILLASRSPRRIEMLNTIGLNFRAAEADVDETIEQGTTVIDAVIINALKKAEFARANIATDDETVVAADTVVSIDERIIGKPKDDNDAVNILSLLSGNTHTVYTGIAIITPDGKTVTDYQTTKVTFRKLSDDEIKDYVLSGQCSDKAGAYGMQGQAAVFVEHIDGDYFNVIGLPLCKLYKHLYDMNCIELI